MELSYLYYFKTIAEVENMSRAAELLHISQPALSKSISKLEASLGVSLFERKKGRISLSPIGAAYYQPIARAFACIEEGRRLLEDYKNNGNDSVSIASPVGEVLNDLIMEVLAHTDLEINQALCAPEVLKEQLLSGQLDFALTPIPINSREIEQRKLMEEEIFVLVHRDHPLADQQFVQLADLSRERFLVNDANFDRKIVIDHCKLAGFEPNIALCSNEPRVISEALEANRGVSLVPAGAVYRNLRHHPDRMPVVPLRITDVEVVRFISIARRKDRIQSDSARKLYHFAVGHYEALGVELKTYFDQYFPPRDLSGRKCLYIKDIDKLTATPEQADGTKAAWKPEALA
jgi:DNA-binding transcriptional LysR family regulator